MAIVGSWVSVTTTATSVADAAADTTSGNGYRVNVRNRSAVAVFFGGAGVTTGAGYQLDPGESLNFWIEPTEVLFGIVASGTATVHVLKGAA